MKKSKPVLVVLIIALIICAFTFVPLAFKGEEMPYSTFYESVNSGDVASVSLEGDYLNYKLKSGEKFSTSNPDSPALKETLLLNGVEVKDNTSSLDSITDTIFNFIFIFLIGGLAYKGLSWYHKTFKVVRHTGVNFNSIAGMDGLKKDMNFALSVLKGEKQMPNHRPLKGIILEGPPGNGKTMFAKALAEEAGIPFIATRGADFQGAVMGLGAMKVKMLFNKARKKRPCIIFIDEFDSIGEKRNYAGSGIDKENNRILTTLLNEMDGFDEKNGILVIAATNSYQSLDPALIRPGRFDLKYTISNPDSKTIIELVNIYTHGKKLNEQLTPEVLATIFAGLSSAAIATVLNEAEMIMMQTGRPEIGLECLIEASVRCKEKLNIRVKKN